MKGDGRALDHATLEGYRYAAIELTRAGVPIPTIAKSFRVGPRAVYRWLQLAKETGVRSLKSKKAEGPECLLTCEQLEELKTLVRRRATLEGYSTDLWSGPRVRHLIKNRFGVGYHAKHMPRLLKRVGLELRFPERRALEQDPIEVRRWKRIRLPEIIAYTHKKRAVLFYADEALISLIPYVGRSWAVPGSRPTVRVSGKRGQHVGVTAAVNQQGRMCFELTKEKERFTGRVFIRFLKKMRTEFPMRHIVLIVDGAPIHKSKLVKAFLAKNKGWLRVELLPAYSPELNPTEHSWRFIKTKKLNGSTVANKRALRKETGKVLRSTKKDTKRVISFFNNL